MKQLLFLNLIIAVLSSSVQAATVTAYADEFLDSSGNFLTSGQTPVSEAELATIVTSDITTFAYTTDTEASFDLGFGSNTTVTTGSGVDLVIFTAGNGYLFGLEVYGTESNTIPISNLRYIVDIIPSYNYDPTLRDSNGDPLCINGDDPCPAVLSGTNIDFLETIADGTEISFIRVLLGSGAAYTEDPLITDPSLPNFTLARAEHATVVPLPLPAVLFSSGLLLLSWVGRRKKHS